MVKYENNSVIGEITYGNGKIVNEAFINGGINCLAVVTYDECNATRTGYDREIFCHFNDEDHLKKELGLCDESPMNWMDLGDVTTFKLNKDHPTTPILAKHLAQAKWKKDIMIKLVSWNTEEKGE